MSSMNLESKLERERVFHNHAYAEDTRMVANKYYAITNHSRNFYREALLTDCAGKRVLEFGCADGSSAHKLAQRGAQVVGIDISDTAIQQAEALAVRQGLADKLSFQVMNAEALEFPTSSFDIVCGTGILHHLDLAKALRSITRVLSPQGRAIFVEPLGHNPFIKWFRQRTPNLRTEDEHPLLQRDLDSLRDYFDGVKLTPFHLSSLLLVPFRNTGAFNFLLNCCEGIDRLLFEFKPISRQAWQVVIELSAPRKQP